MHTETDSKSDIEKHKGTFNWAVVVVALSFFSVICAFFCYQWERINKSFKEFGKSISGGTASRETRSNNIELLHSEPSSPETVVREDSSPENDADRKNSSESQATKITKSQTGDIWGASRPEFYGGGSGWGSRCGSSCGSRCGGLYLKCIGLM